jgi:hypothetical protein
MFGRILTLKTPIRAAFTAASLANIGVAHSQPADMAVGSGVVTFAATGR